MNKKKMWLLVQAMIPLFLLVVFALVIVFPDSLPFLRTKQKSYAGLGTVGFAVPDAAGKPAASFNMKLVPAGVSPGTCTDIPGAIVVDSPFLLAETEVTWELWDAVRAHPAVADYVISTSASRGWSVYKDRALSVRHPVVQVSWRDAIVWCNALSAALSLEPAYYLDASFSKPVRSADSLAAIDDEVAVKKDATGFRLPRSAEWELAARYVDGSTWTPGGHPSGSPRPYYFQMVTAEFGVYNMDSTSEPKTKASNALGLYDMSGNVWEWCVDRITPKARNRVVRGGSWIANEYRLQIGGEFGSMPDSVERGQGFRIAKNR